jgi:hypothetical protein
VARGHRIAVGLGMTALFAATGIAPAVAGGPPTLKPSLSHHFRVLGDGIPALPSLTRGSMAEGLNGDTYVVGQRKVGKALRVVFLSHRHGAKKWVERMLPASATSIYKYTSYDAQLSPNGKRVVVSVSSCAKHKFYLVDSTVKNFGKKPSVQLALSGSDYPCSGGVSAFRGFVAQGNRDVTVLLSHFTGSSIVNSVKSGPDTAPLPAASTTLPQTGTDDNADQIIRDPKTDELTVVGDNDFDNTVAWEKPAGQPWSAETIIDTFAGALSGPESVTSYAGKIMVWICRYDDNFGERPASCGWVQRSASGAWSKFQAMTGVPIGSGLSFMLLQANPHNGHVHGVWYEDPRKGIERMMHIAFLHGAWTKPQVLALSHHFGDLDSLGINPAGHPVVGFRIQAG